MIRLRKSLGVALVLSALLLAGCGSSSLTRDELKNHAQTVQSLVAEAALLASDTASGKTLPQYTTARSGELSDAATSTIDDLNRPAADTSVREHAAQLVSACRRVASDLDRLQKSPNEQTAEQINPDLQHLKQQVQREVSGL